MLTLKRCTDDTIFIGEDIRLTVYDQLRYHVVLGVLMSDGANLRHGQHMLRPATLPGGERFYLLTLMSHGDLWMDCPASGAEQSIQVRVRFDATAPEALPLRKRPVMVDIEAPRSVDIYREEVYWRLLRENGEPLPALSFSAWLRRFMHPAPRHAMA